MPSENKWGPVIHPIITHALGFDVINGRDILSVLIKTTRTVVFDIGAGQTITKVIPPDILFIMQNRNRKIGTSVNDYYHTGGNLMTEEGDRVIC
jgi:hypothetical protein